MAAILGVITIFGVVVGSVFVNVVNVGVVFVGVMIVGVAVECVADVSVAAFGVVVERNVLLDPGSLCVVIIKPLCVEIDCGIVAILVLVVEEKSLPF